jgi:hypothetical protein
MVRSVLGVIVGYIAMAVFVLATFAIGLLVLSEKIFVEGRYEASMLWCLIAVVLTMLGAVIGGWVCAKVARKRGAVTFLAGLLVVFGLISAFRNLAKPENAEARATLDRAATFEQKMAQVEKLREPNWFAFVVPVLGGVGVMLGGRKAGVVPGGVPNV